MSRSRLPTHRRNRVRISPAAQSPLAVRRLIAGRSGTHTQRMNAAPLTTIPKKKHKFAKSALCVSANTNRQVHQPTRNETTNPAIGIAILSTYARNLADTLHVHTLIVLGARGHLHRLPRLERRQSFGLGFRRFQLRKSSVSAPSGPTHVIGNQSRHRSFCDRPPRASNWCGPWSAPRCFRRGPAVSPWCLPI
jgi:hypothetical protein